MYEDLDSYNRRQAQIRVISGEIQKLLEMRDRLVKAHSEKRNIRVTVEGPALTSNDVMVVPSNSESYDDYFNKQLKKIDDEINMRKEGISPENWDDLVGGIQYKTGGKGTTSDIIVHQREKTQSSLPASGSSKKSHKPENSKTTPRKKIQPIKIISKKDDSKEASSIRETLPTSTECRYAVLKIFEDGKARNCRDCMDPIIKYFNLSEAVATEMVEKGRETKLSGRIRFAFQHLKGGGLLDNPSKGMYQITQRGLSALKDADKFEQKERNGVIGKWISDKEYTGSLVSSSRKDGPKNSSNDSSLPVLDQPLNNDWDFPYVVFISNGVLCLVGKFPEDVSNINSSLVDQCRTSGGITSVMKYDDLKEGLYEIEGVKVRVDEKGEYIVSKSCNPEFHNQSPKYDINKKGSSVVDINALIALSNNNKTSELQALLEFYGPDKVWGAFIKGIESGEIDASLAKSFTSNFRHLYSDTSYDDFRNKFTINNDTYLDLVTNHLEKVEIKEDEELREATVREAKPSLLKRVKEKFGNLKTWQKVAIVGGVLVIAGVAVYTLVPGAKEGIDSLIQTVQMKMGMANPTSNASALTSGGDVLSNAQNGISTVGTQAPAEAVSTASSVDFSQIGQGDTIFSSAYDAVSGNNPLHASEWLSNTPTGVFNTVTHQFTQFSPEQLMDTDVLNALAQDPNNALTFGTGAGLENVDGFMNIKDVINEVTKNAGSMGGKII